MLLLIVKLYKTISIKYNLKQNITILSFIAHGFLNILTADMLHDLKNARSKRSLKSSNHLSNITENLLDVSSLNPHDTTGISSNPTGITSILQYILLHLFLLLPLMITNIFHLMIQTLQILWSLIMTVQNNITFAKLISSR